MNKTDKILSYLPDLYRDRGKESIIYHLIDIFGRELQDIEDNIFEVMRSHWVNHADRNKNKIDDLARLGSMFDIKPMEGESVEEYRQRLKKMIRIYIDGVGTIRAIIEVVAAILGVDVCPKITLPNTSKEVDKFTTIAKMVYAGQVCSESIEECPNKCKNFELEIIDNPEKSAFREVRQDEVNNEVNNKAWEVANYGIYRVRPSITITASSDNEIKNPIVINRTTGQTVVYVGTIPKGSILKIVPGERAVVDNKDIADRIFYFAGCRFEEGKFNLSVFERVEKGLFGPELPAGIFKETKFDECVFGPIEQRLSPPELLPGKTEWTAMVLTKESSIYTTLKDRFKESRFDDDEAVFDHSGFDVIALDLQEDGQIHGEIRLDWVERQTATFMVRLPRNLQDLLAQKQATNSLEVRRELLEKEIRKVKAAGVTAIIEYGLKPFEETHEQISELLPIENRITQPEEHKLDDSLKIELEGKLVETHPIVDTLVVDSEIRTKDIQAHEDKFGVKIDYKWTQLHEQTDKLSLEIEAKVKEKHLMKDILVIQGVFDSTYFDTSYFMVEVC